MSKTAQNELLDYTPDVCMLSTLKSLLQGYSKNSFIEFETMLFLMSACINCRW